MSPVIALSGAIGSGKAALAAALAKETGASIVSFGDEVRRYVTETGGDPADRSQLQFVGQGLILNDLAGFVSRVVHQADPDKPMIVAGVRHWEALYELRRFFGERGRRVVLVHVETSQARREKALMADGTERRLVARYDNDISEAQVARMLPQYAYAKVDGDLPVELQVKFALGRVGEVSPSTAMLHGTGDGA